MTLLRAVLSQPLEWIFLVLLALAASHAALQKPKTDRTISGVWEHVEKNGAITETVRFEFVEKGRAVTGRSLRQLTGPHVNSYATGSITGTLSSDGKLYTLTENITQRHPSDETFCSWKEFNFPRAADGSVPMAFTPQRRPAGPAR
jgi:hypothetical protein